MMYNTSKSGDRAIILHPLHKCTTELLTLCRSGRNKAGDRAATGLDCDDKSTALDPVKRLQAKLKLANPEGKSLVDELIAERRSEAMHE